MANTSLQTAKNIKNDEFYTRLEDINEEMNHYEDKFRDKIIFCNCDDPKHSNFWRYFHMNFEYLGLKKLIATHYEPSCVPSYKIEYSGGNDTDFEMGAVTPLAQNGDFRSDECIELLKQADIIVTNPPFSLFREYVAQLIEYDKKFIIIGSKNAITYKDFFPLLMENKVWFGYNNVHKFLQPDGSTKLFGNVGWYINLDIKKRHSFIETTYFYSKKDELYPDLYPTYDNYAAISVDKISEIPMDYDGAMGVPITFFDKYCPDQFDIMGISGELAQPIVIDSKKRTGRFYVGGKRLYDRIVIRRKNT